MSVRCQSSFRTKTDVFVRRTLSNSATPRSRAVLNKPLRALSLKDDVLVAAIARGSEIIIPSGTSIIQEGDHVVVVTNAHTFDDLGDILA